MNGKRAAYAEVKRKKRGIDMRTQYRRIRVRKRRRGWLALLCIAVILLGAYRLFARQPQPLALSMRSAQTESTVRTYTLEGMRWYALSLGACEDGAQAIDMAQAYQKRGAAGYIDSLNQVLAAAYDTREDALLVQQNLLKYHGVETVVQEIYSPSVTVEMEGLESRTQALCEGYDLLCAMAGEMYRLSLQLDKGETDAPAAKERLLSYRRTAQALCVTLTAAFGGDTLPKEALHVHTLLSDFADVMQRGIDAESPVLLGGMVKYAQILCIAGLQAHKDQYLISSP